MVGVALLPRDTVAQGGGDGAGGTPADTTDGGRASEPRRAERAWYDRLRLRGYAQFRHNGLLRTNPALVCAQCDRRIGRNSGISIRRARLVLSGDVNDRVSIYIQPDFASEVDGVEGVLQLRDAYADIEVDPVGAWRVRLGQSKMPFGFENLQSSSDRIPLDRADGTNSAMVNERDLGALVYWAPPRVRRLLRQLAEGEGKGSGEYGVLGIGVFNGQGANRADANDKLHGVARLAYPFRFGANQVFEPSVQGYAGRVVLGDNLRSSGLVAPREFADERLGATLVLHPRPFGVQAEWNFGRGPAFDAAARTVRTARLEGGYVQATYRLRAAGTVAFPYVRAQRYDGGKKFELDARRHRVRDVEAGVEWQSSDALELTLAFQSASRQTQDLARPAYREAGRLVRLQAQVSF